MALSASGNTGRYGTEINKEDKVKKAYAEHHTATITPSQAKEFGEDKKKSVPKKEDKHTSPELRKAGVKPRLKQIKEQMEVAARKAGEASSKIKKKIKEKVKSGELVPYRKYTEKGTEDYYVWRGSEEGYKDFVEEIGELQQEAETEAKIAKTLSKQLEERQKSRRESTIKKVEKVLNKLPKPKRESIEKAIEKGATLSVAELKFKPAQIDKKELLPEEKLLRHAKEKEIQANIMKIQGAPRGYSERFKKAITLEAIGLEASFAENIAGVMTIGRKAFSGDVIGAGTDVVVGTYEWFRSFPSRANIAVKSPFEAGRLAGDIIFMEGIGRAVGKSTAPIKGIVGKMTEYKPTFVSPKIEKVVGRDVSIPTPTNFTKVGKIVERSEMKRMADVGVVVEPVYGRAEPGKALIKMRSILRGEKSVFVDIGREEATVTIRKIPRIGKPKTTKLTTRVLEEFEPPKGDVLLKAEGKSFEKQYFSSKTPAKALKDILGEEKKSGRVSKGKGKTSAEGKGQVVVIQKPKMGGIAIPKSVVEFIKSGIEREPVKMDVPPPRFMPKTGSSSRGRSGVKKSIRAILGTGWRMSISEVKIPKIGDIGRGRTTELNIPRMEDIVGMGGVTIPSVTLKEDIVTIGGGATPSIQIPSIPPPPNIKPSVDIGKPTKPYTPRSKRCKKRKKRKKWRYWERRNPIPDLEKILWG